MKTIILFIAAVLCVGQTKDTYPRINAGTGVHTAILNCTAAGANTTTYACSTTPSFTPAAGDVILFCPDVANTGASTLNVNAAGAKPLKQNQGQTPLVANDLRAAPACVAVQYDGTNWDLQGQGGNASGGATPVNSLWCPFGCGLSPSLGPTLSATVPWYFQTTIPYPGMTPGIATVYSNDATTGHIAIGFMDSSGNRIGGCAVTSTSAVPLTCTFSGLGSLAAGAVVYVGICSDAASKFEANAADQGYTGAIANQGETAPTARIFSGSNPCTTTTGVTSLPTSIGTRTILASGGTIYTPALAFH